MLIISKLAYDIQNIIGDFINVKSKCRFSICVDEINLISDIKLISKQQGKYLTDKILTQKKI